MQVAVDAAKECCGAVRGLMRERIALMLAMDTGDTQGTQRLA
jgi:hypothetical protein